MNKTLSKVMSLILSIAMMFSISFTGIQTAFATEGQETVVDDQSSDENSQDYQPIDLESLIDDDGFITDEGLLSLHEIPYDPEKYTEILDNGDGTYNLRQYMHPIKYKTENGEYEYMDATLLEIDDSGTYETQASDVKVQVLEDLTQEDAISISYGDYNIAFQPLNILAVDDKSSADITFIDSATGEKEDSIDLIDDCGSILYSKTFDESTDIVITPTGTGVEEEIILSKMPEESVYSYQFTVRNVIPLLRRDGNLYFVDLNKGMIVAAIPIPTIYDSTPEAGPEYLPVTLKKLNDYTYEYSIYPDQEYLKNAIYPVVIDPTIVTTTSQISDTHIRDTRPNDIYYDHLDMCVGHSNTGNTYRGLVLIGSEALANIRNTTNGYTITGFWFHNYENYSGASTPTVRLHQITGDWIPTTVKWANRPSFNETAEYSQTVSSVQWYHWNITSLGTNWLNQSVANKGILFKIANESLIQYKQFNAVEDSSNQPYFEITYTDNTSPTQPSAFSVSPAGWTNGSITIGNTTSTDAGSGINRYEYSITSATSGFTTIPGDRIIYPNGSNYVWVRAVDNYGNISTARQSSNMYYRDVTIPTAPTVTTNPDASSVSSNSASPILSWSGMTDSGGSGLSYAQYKVDSGSWIDIDTSCGIASGSLSITLYTAGSHTIYVRGVDAAGNIGNSGSVTYVADPIPYNARVGMKSYESLVSFDTQSGTGYINPDSGNMLYETTDVSVNSPFGTMAFDRCYNSQTTYEAPLGVGWDYSYDISLIKQFDESHVETGVALKLGNGSMYFFTKNQDGSYARTGGLYATLTKNPSTGRYTLTFDDDTVYAFNAYHYIDRITNYLGNYLQFTYNTNGKLTTIADNAGNTISITYSAVTGEGGLIKTVTGAGKTVNYVYSSRILVQAYVTCDSQQVGEQYTYTDGMITTVTNPNGDDYDIAYTSDKVTSITNPLSQIMTIGYSTDSGYILITTVMNYVTQQYWYDSNSIVLAQYQFESETPTAMTYDSNFNVTHVDYPDGTDESYTYNSNGTIDTFTNKLDDVTSYEYDDTNYSFLPTEITEPFNGANMKVTEYEYDANGNLVRTCVTGVEGNPTTTYTYTTYNNVDTQTVTVTDGANVYTSVTDYDYDTLGRLIKTTLPDNTYTEQTYDANGNVEYSTDAKGIETRYYYNMLGQQTQQDNAYGTGDEVSTYYTYDKLGHMLTQTDAESNVTEYTYDALGRQTRVDHPNSTYETTSYTVNVDGTQVTAHYDADGNKSITVTNKKGQTTLSGTVGVSGTNNTSAYTYNSETLIQYTRSSYDVMGNVTWSTDQTGVETENDYNDMGWVTETRTQDDQTPAVLYTTTTYTYDDAGNVLTETTPEATTTTTYDKLNRPKTVTVTKNASSTVTEYDYNGVYNGKLRTVMTDPLLRETIYEYDESGHLIREIYGDRTTVYTYDDNGNMLTSTLTDSNYSGQSTTTTYEYDNLNRKTKIIYNSVSGQYIEYDYYDNGNVWHERLYENGSLTSELTYTYDSMNRVLTITRDSATIVEYTYTDNGSVASIEYGSNGQTIGYEYDEAGKVIRVKDITDSQNPVLIREYFYVDGQLSYLVDKRGTDDAKQEFTYDSLGRLTAVKYYDIDDVTVMEEYAITYNDTSTNVKYQIETETTTTRYGGTVTVTEKDYTYDNLGRLTQESVTITVNGNPYASNTTSYTYDAVGNRLSMTSGATTLYYQYGGYDQLLNIATDDDFEPADIVTSYTYDLSGNQITETQGTCVTTYHYDDANWLQYVTEQVGQGLPTTLASYNYDANGQRTQKTVGSNVTKYYYTGIQLLYTKDGSDAIIEQNILEIEGNMICSQRADTNYYWYRQDIRGSVTNIVDVDDDVVKSYTYDAYGNTTATGTFINSFAYTCAVIDSETGLYYMNTRYYEPETGRFISQDTYRGGGESYWNLYSYCNGNPVLYIDSTGCFSYPAIASGISRKLTTVTAGNMVTYTLNYSTTYKITKTKGVSAKDYNKYFNLLKGGAGKGFRYWKAEYVYLIAGVTIRYRISTTATYSSTGKIDIKLMPDDGKGHGAVRTKNLINVTLGTFDSNYINAMAHEFGHLLGIHDAYGTDSIAADSSAPKNSIMGGNMWKKSACVTSQEVKILYGLTRNYIH